MKPKKEADLKPKFEQRLFNPATGSAIERARNFGIDLTLIIERLRLSPEERVIELQKAMFELAEIRGAARRTARQVIK